MNYMFCRRAFVALLMFCGLLSQAQTTYTIDQGSSTDNDGILYDQGGPAGPYQENVSDVFTITPSNGKTVKIHFTQFAIESGVLGACVYDYLEIYDGPDTLGVPVGQWCGSDTPPDFESSGNALTIRLFSDLNSVAAGFEMYWSTDSISQPVGGGGGDTSGYCMVSGWNCDTLGVINDQDYIEKVQLADLTHSSICSPGGYSDYTHKVANVTPGEVYQLSVNLEGPGGIPGFVYGWIDWNQDSIFSNDEELTFVGDVGAEYFLGQPFIAQVQVPADTLGLVRLRVKLNGSQDPCALDASGEAEDYHLNVGGFTGGYCAAQGGNCSIVGDTNTSPEFEFIESVLIPTDNGDLNNVSGCNAGYADFSQDASLIGEWSVAGIYDLVVTPYFGYQYGIVGVWIDWNNDQDFDDPDEYFSSEPNLLGEYPVHIIVPANASSGLKRMRIRSTCTICDVPTVNTPEKCGKQGYGEVEDYSVLVGERVSCTNYVYPEDGKTNLCTGLDSLVWNSVAGATGYRVYLTMNQAGSEVTIFDGVEVSDTVQNFLSEADASYQWHIIPVVEENAAFDCDTATFSTTPMAAPSLSADNVMFSTCQGVDVEIDSDVEFGNAPLTWYWNGATTNLNRTDTGDVTFNSSNLGVSELSLVVEDRFNCFSDSLFFKVTVSESADAGELNTTKSAYCFGEPIQAIWTAFYNQEILLISSDGISYSEASVLNVEDSIYTLEVGMEGVYFLKGAASAGAGCSDTTQVVQFEVYSPMDKPIISFVGGENEICQGDSTYVQIENYSTGIAWLGDVAQSGNPYVANKEIQYYAIVTDGNGCSASSDTLTPSVNAIPMAPTINCGELSLEAISGEGNYFVWYKNGTELVGENSAALSLADENAEYQVVVENVNGCRSMLSIESFTVETPTVTADSIYAYASGNADSYLWYFDGTLISGANNDSLMHNKVEGSYSAKAVSQSGCPSPESEVFLLDFTGITALEVAGIKVLTLEEDWVLQSEGVEMVVRTYSLQGKQLENLRGNTVRIYKTNNLIVALVHFSGNQYVVKLQ